MRCSNFACVFKKTCEKARPVPGPHMPCAHSPIIRRTSTLIDFHCMAEPFFCSNFFVHLFVSTLPHSSSPKSKDSQNASTSHEHSLSIRGQRSSLWGHCVQVWLFTSGSANVQEWIDDAATHVKRHRDSPTLHQSTLLWEQCLLRRPQVCLTNSAMIHRVLNCCSTTMS